MFEVVVEVWDTQSRWTTSVALDGAVIWINVLAVETETLSSLTA
jgi:hypothetical protein